MDIKETVDQAVDTVRGAIESNSGTLHDIVDKTGELLHKAIDTATGKGSDEGLSE